jgi:hypothetical protein
MRNELCQSFALLPGRSQSWIWITKPSESRIKKFICGRSISAAALFVEGPTKNELCRTIVVSTHPSEPMVDEGRLPDPSPGNDCNDVDTLVCPCTIQKSDILVSAKNSTSCNGQSGYGNPLRCNSCRRFASKLLAKRSAPTQPPPTPCLPKRISNGFLRLQPRFHP